MLWDNEGWKAMEVCVRVRVSHHVTGQVVQVIKGTLQGVCVHIQNDHIL